MKVPYYNGLRYTFYSMRENVEQKLFKVMPKRILSRLYKRYCGKRLDWHHPRDINEKMNWLKINGDTNKWSKLADKYQVRQFVEQCGLDDMLIPLIGKWDKVDDIEWEKLPHQFVMKTNHGTHDVLICHDKGKLDTKLWTQKFDFWLKHRFGSKMAEPHYDKIVPCIIAEQLLDNTKQDIESSSLVDYKIWSFDGKPSYICIYYDRTPNNMRLAIYDTDWQPHPEFVANDGFHLPADRNIPRPRTLDKMLSAAAVLSKGFPEVRVDLYEVDGKPYFGELTFTAAGGFITSYTQELLNILGDKTEI